MIPTDCETTVSQGLDVTDDKAKYDSACKRLLSEKVILSRIMKACLEEYKDCDVNDIAEKYIEGQPQVSSVPVLPDQGGSIIRGMDTTDKSLREGTITYDIRYQALVPNSNERIALIINVEAQNKFYPGYPLVTRGIYYCCRMISSQYGQEFFGSQYERIKKVYSIWICMNPPKNRENTITRYRLTEEHLVGEGTEPVGHYDLLSIVMLCLGGPEGENYDGVIRMLDVLLGNETSAAEKRRILQNEYDIQMTQAMERKVSDMCNLSQGIEDRGIARGMARGIEKGMAQGIAQGKAQGIAQGMTNGILASIKSLRKNMGISVEQAMSILEIPTAERPKYIELLKMEQ